MLLPEDLRRKAFAEARRLGVSFGEFVREAMRAALERAPSGKAGQDSLLSDNAEFVGGVPSDYSTRHDDYLYGRKK